MNSKETGEYLVHPFAPVFDASSRVLILGSFPSVISRQQAFYYANKNNRFWSVLSAVFEEEITDRRAFCLSHHLALWDVISSCRITGSSDASIRDVTCNDIAGLIRNTDISAVFTTGKKASSLYQKYIDLPICHIPLPSTSGANAVYSREDLIREYRKIREYAEKD